MTPQTEIPTEDLNLPARVESLERNLIAQALERSGGSRTVAAEMLRIKRTTLVMKLKRYGLGGAA